MFYLPEHQRLDYRRDQRSCFASGCKTRSRADLEETVNNNNMNHCQEIQSTLTLLHIVPFYQGVQCRMALVVIFFPIFEKKIFLFVVAILDLVHDVEAIHGLC